MSDTRTVEAREVVAPASPASPDKLNGALLEVRVRKRLAGQGHEFVLEVEFQAAPGFTILFGPSGAGKTTLLDCVAGLTRPDSGRIAIGERVLFDSARGTDLAVAKRRVGYVFQNLALFPHLTVEQNVQYGLAHVKRAERRKRSAAVLQAFHIAHLARRSAREISGGESQRVALARTLVTDPAVLFLDEPLAALDAPTKAKIMGDLREWNRAYRIPILYVTHSREEVFALGERVIVLDAGRIVADGTPHEVMNAPQMETVAQLAGFENIFDATVEATHPERGSMTCSISAAIGQTGIGQAAKGAASAVPLADDKKSRALEHVRERGYGPGGGATLANSSPAGAAFISPARECRVEVEIGNESRRDDTGFHTQALPPDEGLASTGLPPQPVGATAPAVLLETPLVRAQVGSALRLGIRAGDILLATFPPQGLSARNVIPGRIASLAQHDVIVMARVRCGGTNSGVEMEVRLTLAARDSLQLAPGKEVWLVIKTHSCHLMQR